MKTWTATQRAVFRASVSVVAGVGMLIQPLAGLVTPPVSTALAQTVTPRKGDTRAPGSGTATVSGASTVTAASATATDLAAAMDINTGSCTANSGTACLVSASLGTSDPVGTAVFTSGAGFPTAGSSFAAISSGNASWAFNPNTSGSTSYQQSGLKTPQQTPSIPGQDMVQLTVTVTVPTDTSGRRATYWAVDWKFLTEEFPEWVGSRFNDTFLIEVGQSNFSFSGAGSGPDPLKVNAPNNVASDPSGRLISVNTSGTLPAVMNAAYANGTTYDGATKILTTVSQVPAAPATQLTLIFSVMDLGDSIYDTTVFLDNFRFLFDATPPIQTPVGVGVPVLWCVLGQADGQADATTTNALIAPSSSASPGYLARISDQIFNNNTVTEANPDGSGTTVSSAFTNVHFKPANPAGMTFVPIVADDHTGGNYGSAGYVTLSSFDNGQDIDHVFAKCRERWNQADASPAAANTGIVAVQILGFVNGSGQPLTGFIGEAGIPGVLDPVDQMKSAGVLATPGSSDLVLAHEFAHALSLYHGDGFDNHPADGVLDGPEAPATPGGPPRDETQTSPSDATTSNLMQLQNTLITDPQSSRARCQTLVIPNIDTLSPGTICQLTQSTSKVGAAAVANSPYRANIAAGAQTAGTTLTGPAYSEVRSLGVVSNPPVGISAGMTSLFASLGLLPTSAGPLSVFLFLDSNPNGGGNPQGTPPQGIDPSWPAGSGIDVAARVDLTYDSTSGQWTGAPTLYRFDSASGSWVQVTIGVSARVTTQVAIDQTTTPNTMLNVSNTVIVTFPTDTTTLPVGPTAAAPLRAITQTLQSGVLVGDDKSATLPLTPPKLPACQVTPLVMPPGGTGSVQAFNLPASATVQASLVGPAGDGGQVGSGTTDTNGAVTISISLPPGATSGQRAINVGVSGSPVVASCDLVVNRPPAADVPPSPKAGTVQTVIPGNPLSFPVQFSDPDAGGAVAVHSVNLPSGASLTCPSPAKTTACTVNWTPTAGQIGTYVVTFTAVDQYGFPAAPLPIVIVVDAQLPKSWATVSPTPNGQGWNKSDVLVTIFASDDQAVLDITYSATGAQPVSVKDAPNDGVTPISFDANGVASTSFTISSEGLTTVKFHATDIAGGSDKGDTVTVKLDKTSPTAALNPPSNGNTYIINQPVTLTCTDPAPSASSPGADPTQLLPSGVASCETPSGTVVDTTSVGVKTSPPVNATDNAGNSATGATAKYVVTYNICLLYDPSKPQNVGSTYAIKLQICDWNNKNLSSSAITLTAAKIVFPDGTAEDAGNANPGGVFRYDGTLKGGGYIYNLNTKTTPPMPPGSYYLVFTIAGDLDTNGIPIQHKAPFQLK